MIQKVTLFLLFCSSTLNAQFYFNQYFDGADTSASNSLFIEIDSSATDVWQIGIPQKYIFDSAATAPNALLTDTVNSYPVYQNASFKITQPLYFPTFNGILALQWKQKIDFEQFKDGGLIEYSVNQGLTWESVFNNPNVYNFFGFNPSNVGYVDTIPMFTGTDSTWRDIWLCLDISFLTAYDTLQFRFTLISDSVDTEQEGWMIDNMMMHPTFVHTINEVEKPQYINVYPSITSGRVHIDTEKIPGYHIIEKMELYNTKGQVVQSFGRSPVKFYIDIGHHKAGLYLLKVQTNVRTEVLPVVLKKD